MTHTKRKIKCKIEVVCEIKNIAKKKEKRKRVLPKQRFSVFFLSSAADCSRLRLAAACGIIKIAQEPLCIEFITLEIFQKLSLVMQVRVYLSVALACHL